MPTRASYYKCRLLYDVPSIITSGVIICIMKRWHEKVKKLARKSYRDQWTWRTGWIKFSLADSRYGGTSDSLVSKQSS